MNDELERRYFLSAAVIIVSNMLGTGGWLSYRSSFSSFSLPSLSLSYRCWKESSQGRDFKRREGKLIENVFREVEDGCLGGVKIGNLIRFNKSSQRISFLSLVQRFIKRIK